MHFLNSGNIFSRSIIIDKLLQDYPNWLIVTKAENIEKYKKIFEYFWHPVYQIEYWNEWIDFIKNWTGNACVSVDFFVCNIPNSYQLEKNFTLTLKKWETFPQDEIIKKLHDFWYVFHDFLEWNDYKKSWDTLSVKNKHSGQIIHISFWWDEIENILLQSWNESLEKEVWYIGKIEKIDFFDTTETFQKEALEWVKNSPLILDNIDILWQSKYFLQHPQTFSLDILKNTEFEQKNLKISDVYLENIEQFSELFWQGKKITVYSKNLLPIQNFIQERNFQNVTLHKTALNILKSFQNSEEIVLCDDVLSKIFIKKRRKKSLSENMDLLLQIKSWDYVVHIDHGIWIFHGIIEKEVGQIKKEYLEIHYKENDKLFVPITEVRRISKYVWAENPKLTALHTKEWSKKIQKVSEDVYQVAQELLELYAERKIIQWQSFEYYSELQNTFQQSFDYTYTADQVAAIEDILIDMQKPNPMERILVGDVGFGKTEVALNALYNAFLNKKQAILLSPLVVLAYEHYEKARQRLTSFGVNVEILTRFEKPQHVKKVLEWLKNGTIDIIIGTHRVLSENIVYKDLWLLVIDEEHKFWVKDKESIKKIKTQNGHAIDILSMSATPIPRSLNMALNGIKEVSLLSHAPASRLPIETSIAKMNDDIIRQTWLREFERGGQLYFIHNRVETIESMQFHLQKIFPDKSIIVTHWQLHWDELEKRIIDFKQRKYDILLSSTVIENGIDFPNVNTIIINDAYKFGISQIHQLRGRVGRSDRQGYCLLLFSKDKITEDAAKRLSTLVEYSHLWAGFELAVRDLEIRGWGDILGVKQSWKASEVWISLYLKMLEEKIEELKLKNESHWENTSKIKVDTTIDLNVEAYIEWHLFQSELDKIHFYKEIENISDFEELEEIIQDFTHENTDLKACNYNLFSLLEVRIQAYFYKIQSIKRIWVSYHIDFQENSSLQDLRNFLDLDEKWVFSIIDMKKIKCLVWKFKNDTDFLLYLKEILFPKKKTPTQQRKIIKVKKEK